MKISVIGGGYVGLVTAAALASKEHEVIAIDMDVEKVDMINKGESPITEEGLGDVLSDCIRHGCLKATDDYKDIFNTTITLVCVSTPSNLDGSINLDAITESMQSLGKVLSQKSEHHTVVVRSTVIPGTTNDIIIPIIEKYSGKKSDIDFDIAVNPEFMQEGKALKCFFNPDRIIIGENVQQAGDKVEELYSGISAPVVRMNIKTAEMVKYASNAFLSTKISFINEIGGICHKLGIDVYEVAKGISFDYRIGDRFLNAGVGFGGSCLPKDLQALIQASNKIGYQSLLLKSVLEINENQITKLLDMVERKLGDLDGKKVCVLGLAFKPDTDDFRNAPALKVIKLLKSKGALVKAYDPAAIPNAKRVFSQNEVEYCSSAEGAISNCDCILILTEWDEFRDETLYYGKIVFDGRRVLAPKKATTFCDYQGICW
ncbi:MAG: UDP-glucose/GDP-mannose dehydrogenase family protein [Dehalococcoidia bacterium]